MIAKRLAELEESTKRWQKGSACKVPVEELAQLRRNVTLENEVARTNEVRRRTMVLGTDKTPDKKLVDKTARFSVLEGKPLGIGPTLASRRSQLLLSSERWQKRVNTDPELATLEATNRMFKDYNISGKMPSSYVMDIGKGLEQFYSTDDQSSIRNSTLRPSSASKEQTADFSIEDSTDGGAVIKEEHTVVQDSLSIEKSIDGTDSSNLDMIAASVQRLTLPSKPAAKNRNRPIRKRKALDFSAVVNLDDSQTQINYRLKQCDDDPNESGIALSAQKGLQTKIDFSGIKLKKTEQKSLFPNLMLIRIKGEKLADVRLVAPHYSSLHANAVFVLIIPDRIFVYHGKYSNLLERSKAATLVNNICNKTGELGCSAKAAEQVLTEKPSDFWSLLGQDTGEPISESYVPQDLISICEPFENLMAEFNTVYEVDDESNVSIIAHSNLLKYKILEPKKVLILDFGSEIYLWIGHSADRNLGRQAYAFADQLRREEFCKGGKRFLNKDKLELLFGEDLSSRRPNWCLLLKISEGIGNCLFQSKFPDWKSKEVILKKKSPIYEVGNTRNDEDSAVKLGKFLSENRPTESVVVFEECPLDDEANVFTEGLSFFILDGENVLKKVPDLWLFRMDSCYVIEWNYRIERSGIRKLDGTEREHDTGRPRTAFFYWLGSKTTKKQQGLCALALRNHNKERHPQERVLQGQEPTLFLRLFDGLMSTMGEGSNIFLVFTSSCLLESHLEELRNPVVFRSHGVYLIINGDITVWYGKESSNNSKSAALKIAQKIVLNGIEYFKNVMPNARIIEIEEDKSAIKNVLKVKNFTNISRMIRIYGRQFEDVPLYRFDSQNAFPFRQESLRETMLIDQRTQLWIWSERTVDTFTLHLANAYWNNRSDKKVVVYKTREPKSFKALFPQWDDFIDEINENELQDVQERSDPIELDELLRLRTQIWPLEKVIARDLPLGVDLKKLEQYLSDYDFERVFDMKRGEYYSLPLWKQIELRKKNKLF